MNSMNLFELSENIDVNLTSSSFVYQLNKVGLIIMSKVVVSYNTMG